MRIEDRVALTREEIRDNKRVLSMIVILEVFGILIMGYDIIYIIATAYLVALSGAIRRTDTLLGREPVDINKTRSAQFLSVSDIPLEDVPLDK